MGSEVYLGNAEVSNLDDILGSDEDVLGLQVPVQNVLLVDVLQAECNLNEPAVRKKVVLHFSTRNPESRTLSTVSSQ